MSLAFSTTKIEPSTEGFDKLALLEATENLNQAWMDLTEAQRGMDEVCAIMENIHTSVDLINKFGKDAIPMLNVDGGLEALLQIPENVITAEKAMEAMGEQDKTLSEKVKTFFSRVWDMIAALCEKALEFFKNIFTSCDHKIAEIKAASEFDLEKEVEVTTPLYIDLVYTMRNDFMTKMPEICKLAESMRDQSNEWCKEQQEKLMNEFVALAKKYENQKFLNVDQGNEKVHFVGFFVPSLTSMKACGWTKDKVVTLVDSYQQNFKKFSSWSQQMKLFALKMREMKINSMNSSDRQTQAAIRASTGSSSFGMSGYTDLGKTIMSILVAAEKINMRAAKLLYQHVCAFYACKQ